MSTATLEREATASAVVPPPRTFYVTFGCQYVAAARAAEHPNRVPHPVADWADADGWLEITAAGYDEARTAAFKLLGRHWSMIYRTMGERDRRFFPLGRHWSMIYRTMGERDRRFFPLGRLATFANGTLTRADQ